MGVDEMVVDKLVGGWVGEEGIAGVGWGVWEE